MSEVLVDIIIRAKNGHDYVKALVDSIRANTEDGSYRILLVDDGSDPRLDVDALKPDAYARHISPRGAVSATNSGLGLSLTYTDSPYILIMDNDTQVPSGDSTWLSRFIAELEDSGPKTACVGATTNLANPPQHILTVPQTYTGDWKSGSKTNPEAVWFVSFCVLFRKSVIRKLGYWDQRFDPGNWEDTDYAVACREAGYSIRVARSVYVHHHGHKTFADDLKNLLMTNQAKWVDKWGQGKLWDMGYFTNADIYQAITDHFHAGQQQVIRGDVKK
jgi:GT2 family glycosyltransferase